MKKLMIAAAVAAMMTGVGFATSCSDVAGCAAWDVQMKLKTLGPKKMSCKDDCGDKSTIYYLDSVSRTLKGYVWACEYGCEDTSELNIVLWDAKNRRAVIACPPAGDTNYQVIDAAFADMVVYGKKANMVAAEFDILGNDAFGEPAIEVSAAAIGGKVAKNNTTCYVKSLSGYVSGVILPVLPATAAEYVDGGLCGESEIIEPCEDITVVYTTLCNVCCDWDGWCNADVETLEEGDGVPALGTWTMKYNKKVSSGNASMWSLVPAYAL